MIDERSLRAPGLDESNCVPVEFAGGVILHLPKPIFRNRPVFRDGKLEGIRSVANDAEFEALLGALRETKSYGAVLGLASYLIRKNYAIDDETLGAVLEYDPADESPAAWPSRIMDVAEGRSADFPRPATCD